MAINSYNSYVAAKGVRELKDNLSHYIRRVESGERIAITAHGRVVAELGPPAHRLRSGRRTRYDDLVASGVIRLPVEDGDPLADWVALRLPAGTAAALIDEDRGDA